jgi:L-serine/L-threonine ammonia-lyase
VQILLRNPSRQTEQAFDWRTKHSIRPVVVSDQAAVEACTDFIGDHRVVVEPACGAALAIVYANHAELAPFNNILVIVCGGVTATTQQLQQWSSGH